jgi:hypothetical protein
MDIDWEVRSPPGSSLSPKKAACVQAIAYKTEISLRKGNDDGTRGPAIIGKPSS